MSLPLSINRVLGDQPFAQIGLPTAMSRSNSQHLVAFGGELGRLQWPGRDAGARWSAYRVGVFGLDDLRCRHVIRSPWPVLSLDFHPTLPLLAVATGCYDGGYAFEGELLLLHLDDGRCVSALAGRREVRRVRWLDGRSLELVMTPYDDWDDDAAHNAGHTAIIRRDHWMSVADRSVTPAEQAGPRSAFPRPDSKDAAGRALADLCAAHGRSWALRRRVWAAERLRDGRVLAALDGVKSECWDASGAPRWSVADVGTGCQIHLCPDQRSAWVNVVHGPRYGPSGWETPPGEVIRLSLADGEILDRLDIGYPVTLTPGTPGQFALRDTRPHRRSTTPVRRFTVEGMESPPVSVGGYDLFNHYFDVRHGREPLFLQGDSDKPHKNKWIVTILDEQVVRLFPLDWQPGHRHLFGGPAIRIADRAGGALIHAGRVHDGQGLFAGNFHIVRRRYPDGGMQWVFTCDHHVTALDTDGRTVIAAYNSGELVALNAADGSVVWREPLKVDGQAADPLSISVTAPGRVLIGTVDGRILDCSYAVTGARRTG